MSEAVTREEQYYRAMLGEGTAPKPITRKEKWLNRIAEAIANGGGTGGGGASGGETVESDFEIVANITLEEETSIIQTNLTKECTELLIAFIPYGSDSNTNSSAVTPNILFNADIWNVLNDTNNVALNLVPVSLNGSGYKYATAIVLAKMSGSVFECEYFEQKSYQPNISQPFRELNNYPKMWKAYSIDSFYKGSDIKTVSNVKLQVWDRVLGVGTRLIVWGR